MKNLRWMISGFVLGVVLSVAPACGSLGGAQCTASNCAGCCTADGRCDQGTLNSACGINAGLCTACGPADQCQGGMCRPITGTQRDAGPNNNNTDGGNNATDGGGTCNSATCPNGCCGADGKCVDKALQGNLQCGANGASCAQCSGSFICNTQGGFCQDTSCLTGCVQGGQCLSGTSTAACGSNGVACVGCASGQTCTNGVCTGGQTGCSPSNCPNGCCSSTGTCLVGTTFTNCGSGGNSCSVCASNQTCAPTSTGGSCQGGTTGKTYGDACASSTECSGIGPGAVCKLSTSSGNATYPGGYCSKVCAAAADCGTTATCIGGSNFGDDNICAVNCTTTSSICRSPGYTCYPKTMGGTDGTCWLDPLPPANPVTPAPANLIGSACTTDSACQASGNFPQGGCIMATDSMAVPTGWIDGYCTADCTADPAAMCGTTGTCLEVGDGAGATLNYCFDLCASGGAGQSDCRTGYVCQQYGTSSTNVCIPNCNNAGSGCGTGKTCLSTGYCQ